MERAALANCLNPWRRVGVPVPTVSRVLISVAEPERFMVEFAAALAGHTEIFLGNPAWHESERAAVTVATEAPAPESGEEGWLMIPTGGTSGGVKFARHDGRTIAAAVTGLSLFLDVKKFNVVGVLPLFHVSGFMAWMRCALTNGDYFVAPWKALEAGKLPALPNRADGWVLSLVPTQLERLLAQPAAVAWLRTFRVIFIGGGPSWPVLLERAAAEKLPLSFSYGMTETAAMATALRPEAFLAGARGAGQPLPHIRVEFSAERVIRLSGESVFRGYFPEWRRERVFETNDIGKFDAGNSLQVQGRRDGVIITGGEKVFPTEVEAALHCTGEFEDAIVFGLPHATWGQQVVAAYPTGRVPDWERVDIRLAATLADYKRPKTFVSVADWRRCENGKLRRLELVAAAQRQLPLGGGRDDGFASSTDRSFLGLWPKPTSLPF